MSILGTMYEERALNCVWMPNATWQYGLNGVTAEPARPAPNALVPVVVVASSGRRARTSQLSATVWPVLVPPTNVTSLPTRTLTVTSTPLKY